MAQWVKLFDNASYVQISSIHMAYVSVWPFDNKWYIYADGIKLKGPFDTKELAQTALDNAIVQLGGSV